MTVVITGASGGIGKFVFESPIWNDLGQVDVIGTYHRHNPRNHKIHCCDLTHGHEVKSFLDDIAFDDKPVLIHCAGVLVNGYLSQLTENDWDDTFNVNVKSAFLLLQHMLPVMRKKQYGRIVFFSSFAPQLGVSGTTSYAASKAALWGFSKSLAKEGAKSNVTSNCLNLGYMDAGMAYSKVPAAMHDTALKAIPAGRFGSLINVTNAIKFLVESDYVTGSCIDISGGLV